MTPTIEIIVIVNYQKIKWRSWNRLKTGEWIVQCGTATMPGFNSRQD